MYICVRVCVCVCAYETSDSDTHLFVPFRVVVRKELANVRQTERTEDGIGDRVQQYVSVAVCRASLGVRNFHAGEDEFPDARLESVQVEAMANTEGQTLHGRRRCRRRRDLRGVSLCGRSTRTFM